MEIINNKLNSLPQQVEENMKNIELLAQYLKEAYKTGLTLSPSDTTIAISNTNADDSVQDGWLFDSIGNLFKINGGDGTNLLLEFYTCFRGQDGRDGVNDIDDNTIANNKLWSSQEIYDKLINYSDRGIYYTTTPPTLVSADVYSINRNQVPPFNVDIPVKQDDLLILVDNYTKEVKTLYSVISEINGVISLYKHADFSSGNQLYQHTIEIAFQSGVGDNWKGNIIFSFTNQEANEYTSEADMFNALYNKLGLNNPILANGRGYFTYSEGIKEVRSVQFVLSGGIREFQIDQYKASEYTVYRNSQTTTELMNWTTSYKDNVSTI